VSHIFETLCANFCEGEDTRCLCEEGSSIDDSGCCSGYSTFYNQITKRNIVNGYLCNNDSQVIPYYWLCDGWLDCHDGEDEDDKFCDCNTINNCSFADIGNGHCDPSCRNDLCLWDGNDCEDECVDANENCPDWAFQGLCMNNGIWNSSLIGICDLSCRFCKESCKDDYHDICTVNYHQCWDNYDLTLTCPFSCGICAYNFTQNPEELLLIAAKKGLTFLLVQAVDDIDADSALTIDAKDMNGNTALMLASMNGHVTIVDTLIMSSADINAINYYNESSLHLATKFNHYDAVLEILKYGPEDIDKADVYGHTAFLKAVLNCSTAMVDLFITMSEANIDLADKKGITPLMWASYLGQYYITETLLSENASINELSNDNRSALMFAINATEEDIVTLLIQKGADFNSIANSDGYTAWQIADDTMRSLIAETVDCVGGWFDETKAHCEVCNPDNCQGVYDPDQCTSISNGCFDLCPPGKFTQTSLDDDCKECPSQTYSLGFQSWDCQSCRAGLDCGGYLEKVIIPANCSGTNTGETNSNITVGAHRSCVEQYAGQDLRVQFSHYYTLFTTCKECIIVPPYLSVTNLDFIPNWFVVAHVCPIGFCCDDEDGCQITKPTYQVDKINDPSDMFYDICYPGRNMSVPFCGECESGMSETVGNGAACSDTCHRYSDIDWRVHIITIFFCLIIVFAVLQTSPVDPQVIEVVISKVLVNFYQLLNFVVLRRTADLIEPVTDIFMLRIDMWMSNSRMESGFCIIPDMSAYQKLLMKQAGSLLLIATLVISYMIVSLVRGCICERLFKSSVHLERKCLYKKCLRLFCYHWYQKPIQFLATFLPIMFICYTMILTAIAQMTICREILVQDDDGEIIKKNVLWYAGGVECEGKVYYRNYIFFIALGIVFPIGFYYLLKQKREKLKCNCNELINVKWYAVVTKSFSGDCWYYECILLLRKLSLITVSIKFIPERNKKILNVVVILFSLLLHQQKRPFRHKESNIAEWLCLFNLLVLVTLTATCEEGTQPDWVSSVTIFLVVSPAAGFGIWVLLSRALCGEICNSVTHSAHFNTGEILPFLFSWDQSVGSIVVGEIKDFRLAKFHGIEKGLVIKDINGILMTRFWEKKKQIPVPEGKLSDQARMCRCLYSFTHRMVVRFPFSHPKDRIPLDIEGAAVASSITVLTRLGLMKQSSERLTILEPLKIRFVKPKFRTGQVVEASWNGIWHRVMILRQYDEKSFEVRMLDGDPHARGEFRRITYENLRKRVLRIETHRYININQFSDLGFKLNGNLVDLVEPGGYAAEKGIEEGWEFIKYALQPSWCDEFWDCIQAKKTYPHWKDIEQDGQEILQSLLEGRRVFIMGFYQPPTNTLCSSSSDSSVYRISSSDSDTCEFIWISEETLNEMAQKTISLSNIGPTGSEKTGDIKRTLTHERSCYLISSPSLRVSSKLPSMEEKVAPLTDDISTCSDSSWSIRVF